MVDDFIITHYSSDISLLKENGVSDNTCPCVNISNRHISLNMCPTCGDYPFLAEKRFWGIRKVNHNALGSISILLA